MFEKKKDNVLWDGMGWDVIHVVRGSAWIVSRITVRKPDMARNLNALNNERSFASVIKTL